VVTAPNIRFLTGPPFDRAFFRPVIERLGAGAAFSVIDPEASEGGWQHAAARMAEMCATERTVLVAHGLAVPAAIGAALRCPPAALVLVNGPVRSLDPITAGLSAASATPVLNRALGEIGLRPGLWLRWLRSSAGLRRAVVNPYVMDRDTVAALCGPLVETAPGRRAVVSWFASLRQLPDVRGLTCPVLLLWGDADPLYPPGEAAFVEAALEGASHVAIPGGQFAHPEERPWELADRLGAWLQDRGLSPRS